MGFQVIPMGWATRPPYDEVNKRVVLIEDEDGNYDNVLLVLSPEESLPVTLDDFFDLLDGSRHADNDTLGEMASEAAENDKPEFFIAGHAPMPNRRQQKRLADIYGWDPPDED